MKDGGIGDGWIGDGGIGDGRIGDLLHNLRILLPHYSINSLNAVIHRSKTA